MLRALISPYSEATTTSRRAQRTKTAPLPAAARARETADLSMYLEHFVSF
jgi:hypothetical protein